MATPEKIYIQSNLKVFHSGKWFDCRPLGGIEYIRKDIADKAVADERERCAKIADDKILSMKSSGKSGYCFDVVTMYLATIAKAIRSKHDT